MLNVHMHKFANGFQIISGVAGLDVNPTFPISALV